MLYFPHLSSQVPLFNISPWLLHGNKPIIPTSIALLPGVCQVLVHSRNVAWEMSLSWAGTMSDQILGSWCMFSFFVVIWGTQMSVMSLIFFFSIPRVNHWQCESFVCTFITVSYQLWSKGTSEMHFTANSTIMLHGYLRSEPHIWFTHYVLSEPKKFTSAYSFTM